MVKSPNTSNIISIDREIYTDGHSPLVALGEDYNQYIVKNSSARIPAIYIINEFLANGLLNIWNIPTPECAIISVPPDLVHGFSNKHRASYYQYSAFGSKVVSNFIDLNKITLPNKKTTFNKLLNPNDLLRIGLFDIWVANDDRKPTNQNIILSINLEGKLLITAIDHAFIFESRNYNDLNPEEFYPSANDHILISELANIIKKHTNINNFFVKKERDYFYFCIEKTEKHFKELLDNVPQDLGLDSKLKSSLTNFLYNADRNKQVFEEYAYWLLKN